MIAESAPIGIPLGSGGSRSASRFSPFRSVRDFDLVAVAKLLRRREYGALADGQAGVYPRQVVARDNRLDLAPLDPAPRIDDEGELLGVDLDDRLAGYEEGRLVGVGGPGGGDRQEMDLRLQLGEELVVGVEDLDLQL